jgi:hypothetical protein
VKAAQLLALSVILVGCGATVSETASPSPTAAAASASQAEAGGTFMFTPGAMDCPANPGGLCPSYTVAEAIAAAGQPGTPLIVDGYALIEPDGTAWYCEMLTDSTPPQCAGERLAFDGLDVMGLEADLAAWGVEELDGVRWSDEVRLLGEVTP